MSIGLGAFKDHAYWTRWHIADVISQWVRFDYLWRSALYHRKFLYSYVHYGCTILSQHFWQLNLIFSSLKQIFVTQPSLGRFKKLIFQVAKKIVLTFRFYTLETATPWKIRMEHFEHLSHINFNGKLRVSVIPRDSSRVVHAIFNS